MMRKITRQVVIYGKNTLIRLKSIVGQYISHMLGCWTDDTQSDGRDGGEKNVTSQIKINFKLFLVHLKRENKTSISAVFR